MIQYDVEYMASEDDRSTDQQVPLSDAYMSGMPAKRRKVSHIPGNHTTKMFFVNTGGEKATANVSGVTRLFTICNS